MTTQTKPSPEQLAEWEQVATDKWNEQSPVEWSVSSKLDNFVKGYVFAKQGQAAEVAALKAQVAELKAAVISDRIEWEDYPPASMHAFEKLVKDTL